MRRRLLWIGAGIIVVAAGLLVAQRATRLPRPPLLEVLLPDGGALPRDFVALARFDAPLDPDAVREGLVYRVQREDGDFGPPRLVADGGDLLVRGEGTIIVFKVKRESTPPVGRVLRVEFGQVLGANGVALATEPVEFTMTNGEPRELYGALVRELGLKDLASIWREWIGEF